MSKGNGQADVSLEEQLKEEQLKDASRQQKLRWKTSFRRPTRPMVSRKRALPAAIPRAP